MAGFCRILIPGYGLVATPLYEPSRNEELLTEVPTLGISTLHEPISLLVAEKQGVTLGTLTQEPIPLHSVASFSKQLDSAAAAWLAWLRVAARVLSV